MKLHTYVMTDDSGYAPNPYWGYLTLACCMPDIRRKAKKDDWIIGFRGKTLYKQDIGSIEGVNPSVIYKIVYMMKITECPMTYAQYYENQIFKRKIPQYDHEDFRHRKGDNCYAMIGEEFVQIRCDHTYDDKAKTKDKMEHDLGGKFVLVSNDFFYFGRNAIATPSWLKTRIKNFPNALPGAMITDDKAIIKKVESFAEKLKIKYGGNFVGTPHAVRSRKTGNSSC